MGDAGEAGQIDLGHGHGYGYGYGRFPL